VKSNYFVVKKKPAVSGGLLVFNKRQTVPEWFGASRFMEQFGTIHRN